MGILIHAMGILIHSYSTIDLQPSPMPELHEPIAVDLQQFPKVQPTPETLVQMFSIVELQ